MTKDPQSIRQLLESTVPLLMHCSDSPRLDAETLLITLLEQPRSYLFAHADELLSPLTLTEFADLIERRLLGEPVAYITGHKEFWSLDLRVSSATLVPRPETELLVEIALQQINVLSATSILDLGTGSGAVALAIASERPECKIIATDISAAALAVARSNAAHFRIKNVEFRTGNWTKPVASDKFQVIVSNPPYVEAGDPVLADLHREPLSALASGTDGLDDIRRLADECRAIIEPGGKLLLEHGSTQEESVADILQEHGWQNPRCFRDLAGLPRVSMAEWEQDPINNQ